MKPALVVLGVIVVCVAASGSSQTVILIGEPSGKRISAARIKLFSDLTEIKHLC